MGRRREDMTEREHTDLLARLRDAGNQSVAARRAAAVDKLADVAALVEQGESWPSICARLGTNDEALSVWCRRRGRSDLRSMAVRDDTYLRLIRLRREAKRALGLPSEAREEDLLRAVIRTRTRRTG